MKIIVHDYGGYAFTRQLAHCLAKRGHFVNYIYSDTTQLIKRGEYHPGVLNLKLSPIVLSQEFVKSSMFKRRQAELAYGKRAADEAEQFKPEVVFSANTPLDAQKILFQRIDHNRTKTVFWMQDVIGMASRKILSRKMPVVGSLIGKYYEKLEQRMASQSDMVIVISEDFQPLLKRWNVATEKIRVIHNWAPLEELPVMPKQNPWSEQHSLADTFNYLYTGILGFKHNPELFIQLAKEFEKDQEVRIVVIAEGEMADWLKDEIKNQNASNLILLPYQPAEEYAQVLATGDVLVAILSEEAGKYSVPSKVMSYLCAQRPVLLSVPPENLAARTITENHAGLASSATNPDQWLKNARILYEDKSLREKMAMNGRRFAENNFDIEKITDQFEEIIKSSWMGQPNRAADR